MAFIDPTSLFNITARDVATQFSPEYQNKLRQQREAFMDAEIARQEAARNRQIQQDYQNALLQQMQGPQYRDVPISQAKYLQQQNALAPKMQLQPAPEGMKLDAAQAFQAEQQAMIQKQREQEAAAQYQQLQAAGQLPTQRETVSITAPSSYGEALALREQANEQITSYYAPAMKAAYESGDDAERARLVDEARSTGLPGLVRMAGVYDKMKFTDKSESAAEVDLRNPEAAARFYYANKQYFDSKGIAPQDMAGGQFVVKYKGNTPVDFKRVDKEQKAGKEELWSEPYETNIGGKKVMVRKNLITNKVEKIGEDKSTTVVVKGTGAGGQGRQINVMNLESGESGTAFQSELNPKMPEYDPNLISSVDYAKYAPKAALGYEIRQRIAAVEKAMPKGITPARMALINKRIDPHSFAVTRIGIDGALNDKEMEFARRLSLLKEAILGSKGITVGSVGVGKDVRDAIVSTIPGQLSMGEFNSLEQLKDADTAIRQALAYVPKKVTSYIAREAKGVSKAVEGERTESQRKKLAPTDKAKKNVASAGRIAEYLKLYDYDKDAARQAMLEDGWFIPAK